MEAFLGQYWPNFAGTVTGGLLLSASFFLLKEWIFSIPQLSGIWECELVVHNAAYNPYRGLRLWYKVTLVQNGNQLLGFGELDREDSASGAWRQEGPKRRALELSGRIEKRITRPDCVRFVWSEQGDHRKFSNVFDLRISGSKIKGGLWGTFASTAAEATGWSQWKRLS